MMSFPFVLSSSKDERLKRSAGAIALGALLGGCTPAPPVLEPIEGPKLGTLERAYDRSKWRWVRNADGRPLLTHSTVARCFVDPEPPFDSYDATFTLKRSEKTIAGTRYQILNVYEKNDFWEAVYRRTGSEKPILSVYAAGRCQREAEDILQTYEQSLASRGRGDAATKARE
jgi:hypothetical protein